MCYYIVKYSPAELAWDLIFSKSAGLAIADPIIPDRAPAANFFQIASFLFYPKKLLIGSYNPSLKIEQEFSRIVASIPLYTPFLHPSSLAINKIP
jgi:hypothetical protein